MKRVRILVCLLVFLATLPVGAQSLRGSRESQLRQNRAADREDLSRIEDRTELRRFVRKKLLVPLPQGKGLRVDPRLDQHYRYCRPWTAQFLRKLRSDFRRKFPRGVIQINSAVRTEAYQRRLRRYNKNAAAADGLTASSHLTGATVDLTKKVLATSQVKWLRDVLTVLKRKGLVEVTEEFNQSVFHVMVFKKYSSYGKQNEAFRKRPATKKPEQKRKKKSISRASADALNFL